MFKQNLKSYVVYLKKPRLFVTLSNSNNPNNSNDIDNPKRLAPSMTLFPFSKSRSTTLVIVTTFSKNCSPNYLIISE